MLRWSPNGKQVVFITGGKIMAAPVSTPGGKLQVKAPEVLFELGMPCLAFELACFDIASDGKRFLVEDSIEPSGCPRTELARRIKEVNVWSVSVRACNKDRFPFILLP
jgi:hypothetical protein